MRDKITIHAVHSKDLLEFLISAGLAEEVEIDRFICAGCGDTLKAEEITHIKTARPKCLVYVETVVKTGIYRFKDIVRMTGLRPQTVQSCLGALKRSGKLAHGWFPVETKGGGRGPKNR
jgi:hypothetical protein